MVIILRKEISSALPNEVHILLSNDTTQNSYTTADPQFQ